MSSDDEISWLLSEQVCMRLSLRLSCQLMHTRTAQKKVFTSRLRLIVKYVGYVPAMHAARPTTELVICIFAVLTPQGI